MSRAIGIDLGTTKAVMAVFEEGKTKIIPNAEGEALTPSYVAMSRTGELLVGMIAKRQAVLNQENTVYSVKRFMGRRWGEKEKERLVVEEDAGHRAYKVSKGSSNAVNIIIGGKAHSPQQVSALILQKLKQDTESYLGDKVTDAVITVPAYFNDSQRRATRDAGKMAGLNVLRIISEPTAAAVAYSLGRVNEERLLAVYHMGGGTFDISILDIGEGMLQVKSTAGDTCLGGDDVDQRVIDWLSSEFKRDQGIDLGKDRMALQRLREAAEKAKIELSTVMQTDVNLPFIAADSSGPKHMNITLTRARLEQIAMEIVENSLTPCRQALSDAGITAARLDEVILVGSSTRMPLVQKKVREFFGKEPSRNINPEEAVARGAAIYAAVLSGEIKKLLLMDVIPLTLSIETQGGVATPLIQRNTTIPTLKSQIFSTAADNQPSIEIHVVQGERPMAADNISLGRFLLDGVLPAPRGIPQIEVSFDIDPDSTLHVRAYDKGTGREREIIITDYRGTGRDQKVVERRKEPEKTAPYRPPTATSKAPEPAPKRRSVEAKSDEPKKKKKFLGLF